MSQQNPTRRRRGLPTLFQAVAIAVALLGATVAYGQDMLRKNLASPGESRPIEILADDITAWADGDKQILLLKGHVWVAQGATNLRAPQGVVWVDQAGKKESGIYNIQMYGETLTLEDGKNSQSGKSALVQLATRGEIRVKSYAKKLVTQANPGDPLFGRAASALQEAAPVPPSPLSGTYVPGYIQQTSASVAAPNNPAATSLGVPAVFPLNNAPPLTPRPTNDPNIRLVQDQAPPGPIVTPVPMDGSPAPPPVPPPTIMPSPLMPLKQPPGDGGPKRINIRPRSGTAIDIDYKPLPNNESVGVGNTGFIITVSDPITKKVLLDIEADRMCVWTKGDSKDLLNNMRSTQGETTKSPEFYLSGNVEIRNQSKTDEETIRADEVYYDVSRNVAIALRADLEIRKADVPNPIHFRSEELQQLNAKLFLAKQVIVYSTILPSDPGLVIQVREAQIEEFSTIKKSIFGTTMIDSKTGQPVEYKQHIFTGTSDVIRLEGVPIFYTPYLKTSVERPLGPLDTISFNYNKIFGFQLQTTFDLYELLGLQRPDNNRWKLFLDEMTGAGLPSARSSSPRAKICWASATNMRD